MAALTRVDRKLSCWPHDVPHVGMMSPRSRNGKSSNSQRDNASCLYFGILRLSNVITPNCVGYVVILLLKRRF